MSCVYCSVYMCVLVVVVEMGEEECISPTEGVVFGIKGTTPPVRFLHALSIKLDICKKQNDL